MPKPTNGFQVSIKAGTPIISSIIEQMKVERTENQDGASYM